MSAGDLPNGYRSLGFETLDSTNEEAKRQGEAGAAGGLWIIAARQTAGRGRRGRNWVSPAGNLMATLLLRPPMPLERCGLLSFVAANTVADVIEKLGAEAASVKWPNDVLIGGAKAAGILLEANGSGPGPPDWLAIGIGINLAHHPDGLAYPATHLGAHLSVTPRPSEVLNLLAWVWAGHYEAFLAEGFQPVRRLWLARALGLHRPVKARLGAEEIEGVFEDLDANGALVVTTDRGRVLIKAGEIHFPAGEA